MSSLVANRVCPTLGIVVAAAGVWAGLGAYASLTIKAVCGSQGRTFLENTDSLKLFIILPFLPLTLLILRLKVAVRVQHLRGRGPRIPAAAVPAGGGGAGAAGLDPLPVDDNAVQLAEPLTPVSISRVVVGGLALPYIAAVVGRIVMASKPDLHPLDRALYGCFIYMSTCKLLHHLYKVKKKALVKQRRILNYVP